MAKTLGDLPPGAKVRDPDSKFMGQPVTWVVADVNHPGYPDDSVTLISEEVLALRQFDASEPRNPIGGMSAGNVQYKLSNIRQWLNSRSSGGEIDYDYLTFTFVDAADRTTVTSGTITPVALPTGDPVFEYSLDGVTWLNYQPRQPISVPAGRIQFRNILGGGGLFNVSDPSNAWTITPREGSLCKASGNINTLIDYTRQIYTIDSYCFARMFSGCTSLITAPKLPAVRLGEGCYDNMFEGCSGLVSPPELPAAWLADACYQNMFRDCISLITAPEFSAVNVPAFSYNSMFYGCTGLTKLPVLPEADYGIAACSSMFASCANIEVSETQTDYYTEPYSLSGTKPEGYEAFTNMFKDTGGTFTDAPEINTIYYTV